MGPGIIIRYKCITCSTVSPALCCSGLYGLSRFEESCMGLIVGRFVRN